MTVNIIQALLLLLKEYHSGSYWAQCFFCFTWMTFVEESWGPWYVSTPTILLFCWLVLMTGFCSVLVLNSCGALLRRLRELVTLDTLRQFYFVSVLCLYARCLVLGFCIMGRICFNRAKTRDQMYASITYSNILKSIF